MQFGREGLANVDALDDGSLYRMYQSAYPWHGKIRTVWSQHPNLDHR